MSFKNKKRIIYIPLLFVLAILAYYQLLDKSERVNSGLMKLERTFKGHAHTVTAVRFSPDDSLLITSSVDSTIWIWKRKTGEVVRTIKQPEGVTYLDVSKDGNYVVTGSYDSKVRIWRISDGALMKAYQGHTGTVWTVAFSNDGKYIASSGDDKIVRIRSTETSKQLHALPGHKLIVWSVKFSPDGTRLASCSFDHSVKLWNVADGRLLRDNNEHTQATVDIAFSHNGGLLASTSDDKTIRFWNTRDGSLIKTMEVREHVQAVAFSPDDKYLITGGRDKVMIGEFLQEIFGNTEFNKGVSARLWDVATGELLQTFAHHSNDVNDVAYSHDGQRIATASADNTVDVWHFK